MRRGRRTRHGVLAVALVLAVGALPATAFALAAATKTVTVGPGSTFTPATQTAAVGDTVQWNFSGGTHNTTRNLAPKEWGSGSMSSGSFSQTFPTAGTFRYWCTIHGSLTTGMRGWIVVGTAPTITIDDASVVEGTGGTRNLVFPITLSAPATATVTIGYITQTGTALGSDFTGTTESTTTIATGGSSGSISVPIATDSMDENDETFKVVLDGSENAHLDTVTAGATDATGTIVDDDAGGGGNQIAVGNDTTPEPGSGTAQMEFTIFLIDGTAAQDITIDWETANGTAIAGSDYAAASGTATIDAGTMSVDVTVDVLADALDESTTETFFLNLTDSSSGTFEDAQGVGTITDQAADGPCTKVGTTGADVLTGTAAADYICGLAGNDTLKGLGANDTLVGGAGGDTLLGAGGADLLKGGTGADSLQGGLGNDNLQAKDGVSGNDALNGGSGTDTCTADPGDTKTGCP